MPLRKYAASIALYNGVDKIKSAFKCRISSFRFLAPEDFIVHRDSFESVEGKILSVPIKHLQNNL